jgi:hypothetical protein
VAEHQEAREHRQHQQGRHKAWHEDPTAKGDPNHYNDLVTGADILDLFKLIIVVTLLAILLSLGVALFHMTSGKGDSSKMLKALTWRIGLSVALFVILAVAGHEGWINPHGFGH